MSVNLIELVKGQLGGSVMEQLSSGLGESVDNTQKAIDAGIPTILGSIVDKVSNDSSAGGMLTNVLDELDDGIADDFTSFLQPDKQESLLEKGGGLLSGLFDSNMDSVVDMISRFSGIGSKSSSSLLGMALPLVLGFIGKQRKAGGLDQDGLMNLLGSQKDHISAAMPSGMSDLLGKSGIMSGLTNMISGSAQGVADAVGEVADSATTMAGDAVDAAGDAASAAAQSAKETVTNAAGSAADAAGQAASQGGSLIRKALPIAVAVIVVLFLLKQCG